MGPSGAYLEFHVPDSITVLLVFVRTVSCVCRTGCNGGGGSGGGGGIRVTTDVSCHPCVSVALAFRKTACPFNY